MLTYRPISQSQYWVQASPFQHYFNQFSGIRDSAATSQYPDGIRQRIYQLKGPRTLSEVTLTTNFDPERHADIVDFWKSENCEFISLVITPVTCGEDPEPYDRVITVPDAQMAGLFFGQVDRNSANPSTIELTFVLDSFTYN